MLARRCADRVEPTPLIRLLHPDATSLMKRASSPRPASRFGGDRGEQVGQRLHFALGVIAEHMRRDLVLVAGMADADADAAEIGAEAGVDRAQAIMAGGAAADSSP